MPYTAKEPLYITKDGTVLRESELDERTPTTLLVGAGGQLSDADAERYGLEKDAPPAEEAAEETTEAPAEDDDDEGEEEEEEAEEAAPKPPAQRRATR